jgi:SAM-dependent methyltransferase
MDSVTAQKLVELNREFYTRFGTEFSATRQRLQPGVKKLLAALRGDETLLDIGCGNGELARELSRRGQRGAYLGVDFSAPLLSVAAQPYSFPVKFTQADLTSTEWAFNVEPLTFNVVFAFAVLHHIPSVEMRLELLRAVKSLLKQDGKFILSNWQFLNSEKLRSRIQKWDAVNLRDSDLDEGDYLLDWRSGGQGLRYAHHFSEAELSALAEKIGMRVTASFLSDGAGGNLGLYQVWGSG